MLEERNPETGRGVWKQGPLRAGARAGKAVGELALTSHSFISHPCVLPCVETVASSSAPFVAVMSTVFWADVFILFQEWPPKVLSALSILVGVLFSLFLPRVTLALLVPGNRGPGTQPECVRRCAQ